MRRSLPSSLELLDHHADRIGQLLAGEAEHFFAQHLGGQKTFAAVSDFVCGVDRLAFRQIAGAWLRSSVVQLLALLGAHRHDVGELAFLRDAAR